MGGTLHFRYECDDQCWRIVLRSLVQRGLIISPRPVFPEKSDLYQIRISPESHRGFWYIVFRSEELPPDRIFVDIDGIVGALRGEPAWMENLVEMIGGMLLENHAKRIF